MVRFSSKQDLEHRSFFFLFWWLHSAHSYSVNHGNVFLSEFAEGCGTKSWRSSKKMVLYLQHKGVKLLRLEFRVSSRELWMHSFTLMEENDDWKLNRKNSFSFHFFFLFQFCSLVFVILFSSLENTTASHLVSNFFSLSIWQQHFPVFSMAPKLTWLFLFNRNNFKFYITRPAKESLILPWCFPIC